MSSHGRSRQNLKADQKRENSDTAANLPSSRLDTPAGAAHQPSLAARVRSALEQDPRFDLSQMDVQVIDQSQGIRLEGWAPRVADRKRLGSLAGRVAGNARIDNCLLVGPPGQHPDAIICQAVLDFMMVDRAIDPATIHPEVTSGVVHLTGMIDTSMHRRYAGALCWWIPGVRGVQNDLQAVYPEPENDELLAETVQLMMDRDPLVDVTEILTLCQDGIVTLSGTVAGQVARDAAESDAWAIEGIHDVINQIEVVPIPGAPPILGFGG